ncbi:MAG: hypothetical protein ACI3W8_07555 [Oscillospiraceae bacterium]
MPTFKKNKELNGIEIYFDKKPEDAILQELRSGGWRWHNAKKCWYNRDSRTNEALAQKLCGNDGSSAKKDRSATTQTFERLTKVEPQRITVSYDIISGQAVIAKVSFTKSDSQYTVLSTNNQLICTDCQRMFSIHAVACPFCGCPTAHVVEASFDEWYQKEQMQKRQDEETRRKQAEIARRQEERAQTEAKRAALLLQEKILEERRRQEEEKQRQIEEQTRARANAIKEMCKDFSLPAATLDKLINSKISLEDLQRRIIRIQGYQAIYPSIKMSMFITNDKVAEFVASYENHGNTTITRCIGNCSTCTRDHCIEEN